ncbi:DUF2182 domain-containing protein [Frigidibacter sp. ROC022]|uniref:DUF2182 domain-containing protein n=1 Tax=Frigidibacter sp. ROC022 TaxID=2971796 RepID=UPI00215A6856|nr:DUF2182 domain-containing protein [Frigidibacter sp. ROC022]MCR8725607.1 DUF2182 domain-containing protein [Frigidibacter sp. ROC022]
MLTRLLLRLPGGAGPRRYRLWLGVFLAVLLAWSGLFALAAGPDPLCGPARIAALPLGGLPVLLAMWALMAAAMMLPTLGPTLAAWADLPPRAGADSAGALALVWGYLAVWLLASLGFALAQMLLVHFGALGPLGALTDPRAAAALLLAAGLWQFTRAKTACQIACLTPSGYFLGRFRPGRRGAVRMGVEIGLACIGCCWALMALAFVGGAMSLGFMGLATLFMVLEKLPALGLRLRRPAGAALIATAAFTVFGG